MAALGHLAIGLAAKKVQSKIPLIALIICAWGLDIVWSIFLFAGVEHLPKEGVTTPAYWSHSLFMGIIWSIIASLVTLFFTKNKRIVLFSGLLVFSHWVLDFITHPMTAAFPADTGIPLFINGTYKVGLGMYSTNIGVNIGEYGFLIIGLTIYIFTLIKIRKEKKLASTQL